jgi:WD40 repeat protein
MDGLFEHKKDLVGHASGIYTLTTDGSLLYSGSGDGMLATWDLKTLEPAPFSVNVGKPIYSVAVHGQRIYIGQSNGGIHVVDRAQKKELQHIQIHNNGVFDILINPNDNRLYSAGGEGSIGVFDLDDMRLRIQIPLAQKKLRGLSLSPDGGYLLVSSSNGYVYVLETEYMNELYNFKAHDAGAYGMSWINGNTLITGGRDAHLRIWKIDKKGAEAIESIPAHNFAIYHIATSNEGMLATASRDKTVKVWNPSEMQKPQRLLEKLSTSHRNSVNDVLWVNGQLFSAGDDRIIKVWARSDS